MADRERDAKGRPLNARPRDGLGRPLTRGAEGTERVPEDLRLPPDQAIVEAQRLLDEGKPFHAHEILEGAWKDSTHEKPLWQGLAQMAVGLTHLLRGNTVGATSLLRQAHDRIRPYEVDPPHGLDIDGMLSWSEALLELLEQGLPASPTPLRLRC